MSGQPGSDVSEHAAAEELPRRGLGRMTVGTRVVPLAHLAIEGRLAPRERRSRLGARDVDLHRQPVRRALHEHRHVEVVGRLARHHPAGRLRRVHLEKILEAHHAPVWLHELRILRCHAAHRARRAGLVAVGARLARRAARGPERLAVVGQHDRRVVRRIEVVAEPHRLAARERIAFPVLFGRHRPLERLQIGDDVHDLLGAQDPCGSPRRHDRVREVRASIPDHLIQVLIRKLPVGERGLVGTGASGGPDVVARHQVAADARPLAPAQKERAPLLDVAGDARRHRHALHRGLDTLVAVGVGRIPIEVARRPSGIANGHPLAVGRGVELAARFWQRARGPLGDGVVVGHVGARARATGAQHHERRPAQRPARRCAGHEATITRT